MTKEDKLHKYFSAELERELPVFSNMLRDTEVFMSLKRSCESTKHCSKHYDSGYTLGTIAKMYSDEIF